MNIVAKSNYLLKDNKKYISYSISGIKSGLGNTIGNSLRRTIISNTKGISVCAYKMSCFKHEFDKSSYIVEDANEIMYNLKEIIIFYNPEIDIIYGDIELNGPMVFKAGLLNITNKIKVVNEDFVICNISENITIKFSAIISNSVGFSLHSENAKKYGENYIGITSVYSKVERVNYSVEINEISENKDEIINFEIESYDCYEKDFIMDNAIDCIKQELCEIQASLKIDFCEDEIINDENEEFLIKLKEIINDQEFLDKLLALTFNTPQELYDLINDAKIQKQLGLKKKQIKEFLIKIKENFEVNET